MNPQFEVTESIPGSIRLLPADERVESILALAKARRAAYLASRLIAARAWLVEQARLARSIAPTSLIRQA